MVLSFYLKTVLQYFTLYKSIRNVIFFVCLKKEKKSITNRLDLKIPPVGILA